VSLSQVKALSAAPAIAAQYDTSQLLLAQAFGCSINQQIAPGISAALAAAAMAAAGSKQKRGAANPATTTIKDAADNVGGASGDVAAKKGVQLALSAQNDTNSSSGGVNTGTSSKQQLQQQQFGRPRCSSTAGFSGTSGCGGSGSNALVALLADRVSPVRQRLLDVVGEQRGRKGLEPLRMSWPLVR
jgi:hypothetical protein